MTPSNPSPDTGAGTPLTALRSASLETVRRYWAGELTERQACDWFDVDRLTFRAALASLDAARSRPATDPAGLDVERLDDAIAAFYGRRLPRSTAEGIAADYARLSVADGPGPEERPDLLRQVAHREALAAVAKGVKALPQPTLGLKGGVDREAVLALIARLADIV